MNLRGIGMVTCVSAVLAVTTGCAIKAPAYQPSINNVSHLAKSGTTPVAVGAFAIQTGDEGGVKLTVRASPMTSLVGANFGDYLAEALKAELELARRFDPKAKIEISGVLLKNVISAGGIVRNDGEIVARFVVRRDGQVRFDKTKRGVADWESSFAGAVAIPKAQQQYPVVVQALLADLYADSDFLAAIR